MSALAAWHRIVRTGDAAGLDALLAEEVVFHSPVVHTPQRGRPLTGAYLAAALGVFGNAEFRYVREVVGTSDALLEFEAEIDGIHVNGVDLIRWNDEGRIVDFKVMLRPLQALEAVRLRMVAALQASVRTGSAPPSGGHRNEAPGMRLPDIEAVSAEVHAAWIESKKGQGVSSRKAEDGEELMVPYEQLSEPAKELDRVTARAVYAAIRRAAGT